MSRLALVAAVLLLVYSEWGGRVSVSASSAETASASLTHSFTVSEPEGCKVDLSSNPNQAIPLLLADDESGLQMVLCESGLQYLREELGDEELYVTSVVGPARKGKSFMLNNLANISQEMPSDEPIKGGFSVGHTAQGHTKGFWLSPKTSDSVLVNPKTGKKVTAIFMDTEGSGATGNFKSYDPKICAIASIFSSNLIYNVMSEISMDNLDFLAKITMFDKYLSQKKNASFPSPPLSWAVQNWEFALDNYDPPTEIGYLRSVLQKKTISKNLGHDEVKQYEEYNDLIEAITHKYSPFDTATPRTLPPIMLFDDPSQKTKKMHLTKLSFSEFDQGYQEQIVLLRSWIREGAKPKEFSRGKFLTGKTFAHNLRTLTDALNQLTHVGDALLKAVAKEAADFSFEKYKTDSARIARPSSSQAHYESQLFDIEREVLANFDVACLGSDSDAINNEVKWQLMKDINSERRVLHEVNYNKQVDSCGREASHHIDSIKNVSSSNSLYNKCGLKALVHINSTDSTLSSQEGTFVDDSAKKLHQLQRCFNSNVQRYAKTCSPDWCDSRNANAQDACIAPMHRTYMEYTDRSKEALEAQKKDLAQMGFQSLFVFVLLVVIALFFPSYINAKVAKMYSFMLLFLSLLISLSFYQANRWLQTKICDILNDWVSMNMTTCYHYSNELPNIIGSRFNDVSLALSSVLEILRTTTRQIATSERKFQDILTIGLKVGNKFLSLLYFAWIHMSTENDEVDNIILNDHSHFPTSDAMKKLIGKLLVVMVVIAVTRIVLKRRRV